MPQFLVNLYNRWFAAASITQAADGSLTLQSAPGRYVVWVVAFIVVMPLAGWFWRKKIGGRYAAGVFFASFMVPLLIIPGMAAESIHVAPDALTMRGGIWFAPTVYRISLDHLEAIVNIEEEVAQRKVSRKDAVWEFRYRDREPLRLKLSDLLDANRAPVLEYLRRHGIPIRTP